jgi:hypothetical protein
MSFQRNGVTFFEDGEKDANHPAFRELSKVNLGDVRFPFGLFIRYEGGKNVVIPATEDDRRKVLLKAFPDIDARSFTTGCHPNPFSQGCHGGCDQMPSTYRCMRMYDEDGQYLGCGCVDIS